MKPTLNHIIIALFILISSCNKASEKITNPEDYNAYLNNVDDGMLQITKDDYQFWEKKLEKEPDQFPYLVKAAASQSQLFMETGHIEELIEAENKLKEANEKTNYAMPSYLRSLARNYISQHRFKESLQLLKKAEMIGDELKATQKMLFDVYLELGEDNEAKKYLDKVENYKDFDFLIRLSKWTDHKGNLEDAILYLRKATELAEDSNNKHLMQWSYTNLADFYGHNGQISESYQHYLKALKLNPNDVYAKKGIAWIVYSHEHNPEEALRILNFIMARHKSPYYFLFKSEIAAYMQQDKVKQVCLEAYFDEVKNKHYGVMYNKYNAILYAEDLSQIKEATKIALNEIQNRPTPQSYDLLAWAYYNYGDTKEAMEIMETHVVDKTHEPEVLFHLAKIYKANGKVDKAKKLKEELLDTTFELGPIIAQEIKNI